MRAPTMLQKAVAHCIAVPVGARMARPLSEFVQNFEFARRGDRALGQDGQHVVDMRKIQENPPAVDQSERCLKDNH